MTHKKRTMILLGILILLRGASLHAGECYDPDELCTDPCPCENGCRSHDDCSEGSVCLPFCLAPVGCWCSDATADWTWLSTECVGLCFEWPELSGPPTHTIIDLGTLGGPESLARAINDVGQVVGEAGLPGWPNVARHAFLWDSGVMIDLGPASDTTWSTAADINNQTQVLVNYSGRAYVWDEGDMIALGGLNPTGTATAYAINDDGQVVGNSPIGEIDVWHSFFWENGVVIDLNETIGMGARDINNSGHIAGGVSGESGPHAAFWDGTVVTDLGTLGGEWSVATGINDLGQVIGESERAPGGDRLFYGFLWDDGVLLDLGKEVTGRDYNYEYVRAFNNCGEFVLDGDVYPWLGTGDADFFVYHRDRGFRPVRGVMGPSTGWYALHVRDMNDAGQIVGSGVFDPYFGPSSRAFLISPIPGDLDGDGDLDLRDYAEFAARVTGSRAPGIPGCERADIDRDADVDLDDFALFQESMQGPR